MKERGCSSDCADQRRRQHDKGYREGEVEDDRRPLDLEWMAEIYRRGELGRNRADDREPLDLGRVDPTAIGRITCTGDSEWAVSDIPRTAYESQAVFVHMSAIAIGGRRIANGTGSKPLSPWVNAQLGSRGKEEQLPLDCGVCDHTVEEINGVLCTGKRAVVAGKSW